MSQNDGTRMLLQALDGLYSNSDKTQKEQYGRYLEEVQRSVSYFNEQDSCSQSRSIYTVATCTMLPYRYWRSWDQCSI
jgi:hypothetical protein